MPSISPPSERRNTADLPLQKDYIGIDTSGLRRALTLLDSGDMLPQTVASVLRQELLGLEKRADTLLAYAQRVSVEHRQLRESKEQALVEQEDAVRQLQDENDKFVEQLIAEHESEVQALRRERDAAIDRVRELSRGLSRVGSMSSPSIRRVSSASLPAAHSASSDTTLLRARIDELLFERERSLRLLRQLAEQRDLAETRLHAVLHGAAAENHSTGQPRLPHSQRTPTDRVRGAVTAVEAGVTANSALVSAEARNADPWIDPRTASDQKLEHPFVEPLGSVATVSALGVNSAVIRTAAQSTPINAGPEEASFDEWDLTLPTAPTPSLGPALPALGPDKTSPAAGRSQPATRRTSNVQLERAGTYSMASEELPAEEVILLRKPIKLQQER